MTQPCSNEDRLLDYLYEEMSPEDKKAFSAHVAGCQHCQRELSQFREVRTAFHHLPPVAPAESAMQRMTAQLLSAARAAQVGAGPTPLSAEPDRPTAADQLAGKVLPFRRRGVMRVLLHPASGILAAAAVALVVVMTQGFQYRMPPREPAALPPPPSLQAQNPLAAPAVEPSAPAGLTALPTVPALMDKSAAPERARLAKSDVPAKIAAAGKASKAKVAYLDEGGTDGALDGRLAIGGNKGGSGEAGQPWSAPKKPAPGKDDLDSLLARADQPARDSAKKELAREEPASPQTSQPPPPPAAAPAPLQQEQKPTVAHAQERYYRSPQATGSSYGHAPPQAAAQPSLGPGAPAETQAGDLAEEKDDLQARTKNVQQNDFNHLMNRRGASPDAGLLFSQLHEQLKKGDCAAARETFAQFARRFPGIPLPEKDQTAYQQTCTPAQNAAPNFEQQAPEAELKQQVQKAPAPRAANRAATVKTKKSSKAASADSANTVK